MWNRTKKHQRSSIYSMILERFDFITLQDFYSKMAPTWLYVDIRLVMVAAKFSDLSPRKIRRLDLF